MIYAHGDLVNHFESTNCREPSPMDLELSSSPLSNPVTPGGGLGKRVAWRRCP